MGFLLPPAARFQKNYRGLKKKMAMLDADITKPTEELLTNLRAAVNQPHMPGLPLLPLGVLLVNLSEESTRNVESLKLKIEELNSENGKLQKWVVALAVVSLIATVTQSIIAVAQYIIPPH